MILLPFVPVSRSLVQNLSIFSNIVRILVITWQTWKKQTQWTPRSLILPPAKSVHFSAHFGFLNMQIRNNLKNVIFIAFKWCKIWKYYVYIMVISLSLVERKKIKHLGWIFDIRCFVAILNLSSFTRVFSPPYLYSENFRFHKKKVFSKSVTWLQLLESLDTGYSAQRRPNFGFPCQALDLTSAVLG